MCQNLSAFQHSCGLLNVYVADGNSREIQCIAVLGQEERKFSSLPPLLYYEPMTLLPRGKKGTCRDVSCMEKRNYNEAQTLDSAEMFFLVLEAFPPFGSVLAKALRNYLR